MNNNKPTRADYLNALLNKKNNYVISNDVAGLAALDTGFSGTIPQVEPQQEKKTNGFDEFMNNVFGFVDEIAAKFGAGFVNGWEGILDLGATGIGAIVDAAGGNGQVFTDWAKQDIGTAAAEWTKTAFGLGSWYNRLRGNSDANEWGDIGNKFLDFNKAAFFAKNNLGDMRSELSDKYYKGNDEALQDMGQAGEFMGGIAHSIGFMLPSIMTAGSTGLSGAAAKGVSTAFLGVSAGGKGAEEALNEGATSGQALGYGAASGAVEAATEWIFPDGGVGGVRVGQKVFTKEIKKEIVKEMLQEGTEEVVSGLMEPLLKTIYKGEEALDAYKDPKKFLFGIGGDFNESIAGQFASGAVTGGLMSGVSSYSNNKAIKKKYGKGANVALAYNDMIDNATKANKYEKGSPEYEKYSKAALENYEEMVKEYGKVQGEMSESDLTKLREAIEDPVKFRNELQAEDDAQFIQNRLSNLGDENARMTTATVGNIARRAVNEGWTFEFDDTLDGNGKIDRAKKVIKVNSKLKGQYGSILAHEYVSHYIIETFAGTSEMTKLAKRVKGLKWYADNESKLKSAYQTEDETYKSLKKDGRTEEAENYYDSEVLANYIQNVIKNKGGNQQQLYFLNKLFEKKGMLKKLISKNKTNDTVMNAVRNIVEAYVNSRTNKSIKRVLKLIADGKKYKDLSAEDKVIYNANKELFEAAELLVENEAYSKETEVDADGNKLSPEQVEFFKDSKVRDENGNLVPVYHSSDNFGFTVFDEEHNDPNYEADIYNISKEQIIKYKSMGVAFEKNRSGNVISFSVENLDINKALEYMNAKKEDFDEKFIRQHYGSIEQYIKGYIEYEIKQAQSNERHHGFYFSDSKYVAETYTAEKGKTYSVYLNLENPLTVDAKGNNWKNIPYSAKKLKVSGKQFEKQQRTKKALLDFAKKPLEQRQINTKVYPVSYPYIINDVINEASDYSYLITMDEDYSVFSIRNEDKTVTEIFRVYTPHYDLWKTGEKRLVDSLVKFFDEKEHKITKDTKTTREFAKEAFENGYDGLIIKDVFDIGGKASVVKMVDNRSTIYVAFDSNQIKNIDNKTPTSNPDIRYSKELGDKADPYDKVTGDWTVGDNNKKLIVRKVSKGYEIVFPDEKTPSMVNKKGTTVQQTVYTGRTITEAKINGKTIKFDKIDNVRKYLKDIKATKVEYEGRAKDIVETIKVGRDSEEEIKKAKAKAKELLEKYRKKDNKNRYHIEQTGEKEFSIVRVLQDTAPVELKDAPSSETMKKADSSRKIDVFVEDGTIKYKPEKAKKKYSVRDGSVVYVNDGSEIIKYEIHKDADTGRWSAKLTHEGSAEIENKEYAGWKSLYREISGYPTASRNHDDVILGKKVETVQENNTVQENKPKKGKKKVNEKKSHEEVKPTVEEKETKSEPKTKTPKAKPEYMGLESTKAVIEQTIKDIQEILGDGFKVVVPINMDDFTWKTFTDVAKVKDFAKEASKLVDKMLESKVQNSDGEYVFLSEMLNDEQIVELKKNVEGLIESAPKSKARSRSAKAIQIQNEMLADMLREFKKGQGRVRVLVRIIDRARKKAGRLHDVSGNRIIRDGLYALMDSIKELHGDSTAGFNAKNFRANVEATLEWYTEDNVNERYEGLPYRTEIRQALIDVLDALGMPKETAHGTVSKTVMSNAMQKAIDFMRLVNAEISRLYQRSTDVELPASIETINAMKRSKHGTRQNILFRLFNKYKRGFAPAYVVIEEMLGGNSEAVRLLVTEMQNGANQKTLYTGFYHDKINKYLKDNNIKRNFDTKKISIRGQELTIDQAMGLFLSTQVQANFEAMDNSGVKFYDQKFNRTVELAKKGEAAELKAEIERALPDEYQKLANELLKIMNNEVKKDYIEWYKDHFGEYNLRNEIGDVEENTYWTLRRCYQKATNLSKAVSNPDAIFVNAISRTGDVDNAIMITGALSTFDGYIDKLGRELFIKPTYETAIRTLNAKYKGGQSIAEYINESRIDGAKEFQYLKNAMADMLGVNKREANLLDKMVSAFSVAKLSLNIGSMLKQFASIWTSNLPFSKSAKTILSGIFNNADAKSEFKKLIDGYTNSEGKHVDGIGGLKYRMSSEGVLEANADSPTNLTRKIAKVGMWGITKMDMLTITTGVYSLMVIGQDQFDAKIGTEENIKFVKEHWHEFELSQIGNGALSKNMVSNSDSLTRYLFGFLQGANRAALGSTLHKYGLWSRNRYVDKAEVEHKLERAKKTLEDAKAEYEMNEDDDGVRRAYIEANAEVLDLQNQLADYESYEIAGGKAIPRNMAVGILAQGIFIALINALMKRIKGKKDLNELDVAEEGLALTQSIFLNWVPFVSQISSIMQGYEVTVPAVEIFNKMSEIFKNGKAGSWRTAIRQCILLFGDMTGVPFETVYAYVYGTLKMFDPAIAYEMRSVLYGSSLQSATTTMKNYADKNNVKKTASMIGLIMKNYKTGTTTNEINRELANLYISGENALPKSAMTSYTDDTGDTVQLTKEQITQFNEIYKKSTADVTALMKLTDYQSATNAEKAKAIKKIYDAYYAVAKAKVTGNEVEGKLAKILALTGGNINLAKYIVSLTKVSQITETTKKARKELVVQYINRLRGFTRAEKTLLMYLAGYTVSGTSKSALVSTLMKSGASRKQVLQAL